MNPSRTGGPRHLTSALLLCAALAACGGGRSGGAVLVGRVDAQLAETGPDQQPMLDTVINDNPKQVPLGDDGSFAIPDLPTGDVAMAFEARNIRGALMLRGIGAADVIEVEIRATRHGVVIRLVRKDDGSKAVDLLPPLPGDAVQQGPVKIEDEGAVVQLPPGPIQSDVVVQGDDVTLVGQAPTSCHVPGGTVLQGKLVVKGKNTRVVNCFPMGGVQQVGGSAPRFFSSCGKRGHGGGGGDDDD